MSSASPGLNSKGAMQYVVMRENHNNTGAQQGARVEYHVLLAIRRGQYFR